MSHRSVQTPTRERVRAPISTHGSYQRSAETPALHRAVCCSSLTVNDAAMATGAYPGGASALGQSLVPLVNRLQDIFTQARRML